MRSRLEPTEVVEIFEAAFFESPASPGLTVDELKSLLPSAGSNELHQCLDRLVREHQVDISGPYRIWGSGARSFTLLLWRKEDPRNPAALDLVVSRLDEIEREHGDRVGVPLAELRDLDQDARMPPLDMEVAIRVLEGPPFNALRIVRDVAFPLPGIAPLVARPFVMRAQHDVIQVDPRPHFRELHSRVREVLRRRLEPVGGGTDARPPASASALQTGSAPEATMTRLFISHAHDDKVLVGELLDLLESGVGIPHDSIFCTSRDGQGVAVGENFLERIRMELGRATDVLVVVTEAYARSQFCMYEMGASWALGRNFLPLVGPGRGFDDLPLLVRNIQSLGLDNAPDLDKLRDRLAGGHTMMTTGRWNERRDRFLKFLSVK